MRLTPRATGKDLWCAAALLLLAALTARQGQAIDILQLHDSCVPTAPLTTLLAIVLTESGGHANAIQLDHPQAIIQRSHLSGGTLRFARQPRDAREALAWASTLAQQGISVDLGLMQVSTAEAQRRHISNAALLDPCTNLQVGWNIFREAYQLSSQKYGDSQEALWHALSRYNSGDDQAGIKNGYVNQVMHALLRQQRLSASAVTTEAAHLPPATRHCRPSDRGSSRLRFDPATATPQTRVH